MQTLWRKEVKCGEFSLTLKRNFNYKEVRMRFLGSIEAKTDVKGRAFFPATFRKIFNTSG